MKKILIELILTNLCNKRCEYCDLNFKSKTLSFNNLDLFINFIKNNNKANYTINFFGGEPLLEFEKLKYFVNNSKKYIKNLSIGTNGILLDKKKLDFFKVNNVKTYLSVDNIKVGKDLNFKFISKYSNIININFINDPDYLYNSILTFEKIKKAGFKNIAFMPIFSTKTWNKEKLIKLNNIYKYILKNKGNINLQIYSYFNGITIDKQFILDTDLFFYSDLDSLLWLQKQYKNINKNLLKEINKKTKLLSLKDKNITLNNLLNLYNINEIIKLVFDIPKKQKKILEYKLIDKILKNGV